MSLAMMTGGCLAFRATSIRRAGVRVMRPAFTNFNNCYKRDISVWSSTNNGNSKSNDISKESSDKDNIEPTWTYTPYQPPKNKPSGPRRPQRRPFSTEKPWVVPKRVTIPEDRLELSYVRSSGAGGQNVNKLNTKAELKFHVATATWMPKEVRDRLAKQEANRINKEGYLSLSSQDHRMQGQNRKEVVSKLEALVLQAWPRPKERKMRKGISKAAKARNKEFKRKRSDVKKNRGSVNFD